MDCKESSESSVSFEVFKFHASRASANKCDVVGLAVRNERLRQDLLVPFPISTILSITTFYYTADVSGTPKTERVATGCCAPQRGIAQECPGSRQVMCKETNNLLTNLTNNLSKTPPQSTRWMRFWFDSARGPLTFTVTHPGPVSL